MGNVQTFTDFCKNFIIDEIEGYVKSDGYEFSTYGYNLADELTRHIGAYSNAEARKYLAQWAHDGDVTKFDEYYMKYYGNVINVNPLVDPDKYLAGMVVVGVDTLMGRLNCMQDIWEDDIEVTQELADSIIAEVEAHNRNIF